MRRGGLICSIGILAAGFIFATAPAGAVENPGDVRNCSDFATSNEAATWFWTYFPEHGDVANLDSDDDGVPCESLPAFSSEASYVDIDLTADEDGLWLTRSDGTVEVRGSAINYGDRPSLQAGEVVTALAPTLAGDGYWLFTNRGNAFPFGLAVDHGDVGHLTLAGDVIDAVPTADGGGYYMIGADGGIFTFGSAGYFGSIPEILPGVTLDAPVVGMSATPGGYVLVAADGGTFAFGSAEFYGSIPQILPGVALASPIVGLVPGSAGYLMLGGDGGIFNFGTSEFHGSLAQVTPATVLAVAVKSDLSGYLILDSDGTVWAMGDTRHIGVQRFTGTGDTVINVDVDDESIVYAKHDGSANFAVWARDSSNDGLDLLVNEIGAFEGFQYLDDSATARIEVDADGNWTVEILPISYARHWRPSSTPTVEGSGNDVLRAAPVGAGSTFTIVSDAAGNVIVWAHQTSGTSRDLLANDIGPGVDVQEPYPGWLGPVILEFEVDGGWTAGIG